MAGLLAYSVFRCLPAFKNLAVTMSVRKTIHELTAAGTAPVFHRIPFLLFLKVFRKSTNNSMAKL